MRLNEKYENWDNIFAETGVPGTYYTPWMQLIKSNQNIANYCEPLSSEFFPDNDIRGLDIYLMTHYGNRELRDWFSKLDIGIKDDESPTAKQNNIRYNLSNSIFEIYGSKWQKLLEALGTMEQITEDNTYNPTENVFEFTDETSERTGKQKTQNGGTAGIATISGQTNSDTLTISGQKEETISGTHATSHTDGKYINSLSSAGSIGYATDEKKTTTSYDHTIERGTAGFNSGTSMGSSSSPGSIGSSGNYQPDNIEIHGSTNNGGDVAKSSGSSADVEAYGDLKTTTSYGTGNNAYKEEHAITRNEQTTDTRSFTTTYGDKTGDIWNDGVKDTVSRKRHGNIGVMTSGQILEGEWVARSHLIYKAMCEDLLNYIAVPLY